MACGLSAPGQHGPSTHTVSPIRDSRDRRCCRACSVRTSQTLRLHGCCCAAVLCFWPALCCGMLWHVPSSSCVTGGDRPFLISGADDRLIKVRRDRWCVCVCLCVAVAVSVAAWVCAHLPFIGANRGVGTQWGTSHQFVPGCCDTEACRTHSAWLVTKWVLVCWRQGQGRGVKECLTGRPIGPAACILDSSARVAAQTSIQSWGLCAHMLFACFQHCGWALLRTANTR